MSASPKPSRDISALLELMATLRTPDRGCPWDLAQNFASIAPYTIEEAYEVAEAIERGDLDDLRDELGDLLLQVVFHARMAEERAAFDFGGVVEAITAKLIRRHPHVFAEAGKLDESGVNALWDRIKADEKAARAAHRGVPDEAGVLAGVPFGLPALARATRLQAKAARVGFDWDSAQAVIEKVREETREVEQALEAPDQQAVEDEVGDLLFAAINLARKSGVDAEAALRAANHKFERRFRFIETALAHMGRSPETASLAEMEDLWQAAKADEHPPHGVGGVPNS